MNIKILLAEDHKIVREGIRSLLENEPDIEIVGEAADGEEALRLLAHIRTDIVVLDMTMPVMNGLECTRVIRKRHPGIKILVLSMHDHENYLIDVMEAGAQGYVLKSTTRDELLFAIRKIMNNGIYIGPEFTLNMIAKYKAGNISLQNSMKREQLNISEREMEVLHLVGEGKTNVEIAGALFTSVRTIETRRKNLLEKTRTNNTASLIRYAVKNGLLK